MLVNQDKALIPEDLRIIRYLEGHPSKITYRPIKPDGEPVEEDVVLEGAIILGPTYHGWGIRVKTADGTITAISREHLVKIEQTKIAGGNGKYVYFGEEDPVQNFGRAGDIFVTKSDVLEKRQKWESVFGSGETDSGDPPSGTGPEEP